MSLVVLMNPIQLVERIYAELSAKIQQGVIPVALRAPSLIGTVQDDPYKDAKYANQSEYDHGPYGEGSVRHRRMYTYPNPLNYKLRFFHLRHILVIKQHDLSYLATHEANCTDLIIRDDKYQNSFLYAVIDNSTGHSLHLDQLPVRQDIFRACKSRRPKERMASMPQLPE